MSLAHVRLSAVMTTSDHKIKCSKYTTSSRHRTFHDAESLDLVRIRFRMQALATDLANHFQVVRSAHQISCILVNLLATDFAFGLAAQSLQTLRGKQDVAVSKMAQCEVSVCLDVRVI